MTIRKLKVERIISDLREVRCISTMKTAAFSDDVKERTRLWRQLWIIEPLDRAIAELEKEMNR